MKVYPYQPPDGYYDQPFTWVFDGDDLTDGIDALNRFVYIQGGYGTFILRRIVGFDRVLQTWTNTVALAGGKFRTYDRFGTPMQSAPVYADGFPTGIASAGPSELGIAPEEEYPETGKIAFDLYSVLKATEPNTAQIIFQGVRRMKGKPRVPNYNFRPKTFMYQQVALVGLTGTPDIIVRQPIQDYDFELYEVRLLQQVGGVVTIQGNGLATITFIAVLGVAGFTIQVLTTGAPNLPLSVTVVPGVSIVVQSATDGAGNPTSSANELLALYNATAAAVAMATLVVEGGAFPFGDQVLPLLVSGAAYQPLTTPIAKLWIRDADRVAIASKPVLDLYMDGTPGSPYQVGAIVPPLLYPKDHLLQIDVQSVL